MSLASDSTDCFRAVREFVQTFPPSRERSLAATKIDEAEMWLIHAQDQRTPVS